MSSNLASNNNDDDRMNIDTYNAVMGFSTKFGFPFAAGLTVMFTGLVLASGIFMSILAGVVTIFLSYMIVKMFFSH